MKTLTFGLGLLICLSCSKSKINEGEANYNDVSKQDDVSQVSTIIAKYETLSYQIQAQGKIEARNFMPIAFEVSGLLKSLHVRNASFVKEGQLIASLQDDLQRIEVKEAKQNLRKVKVDFESRLASFGDSLSNPKNWVIIKENVASLAGLQSAEVALERAQLNLSKTTIRSPFSGIIEGLEIREGESVVALKPIGRMVNQSSLEVLCHVLEFDLGKLSVGDSAAIFPLAYPGMKFLAKVREINPKVEETGYVKVRLSLQEGSGLLEGMSTRVEIYVPESKQILVPKSAVVKKSGRDVVFTVEDSLAKWNYVILGKENGRQVEVLEGLEGNEEVIISNNLQLVHDSPVLVKAGDPSP